MRTKTSLLALVTALGISSPAHARPEAPEIVRATYPSAPVSFGGPPPCTLCHSTSPARNAYGDAVFDALSTLSSPPFDAAEFKAHLGAALISIDAEDADEDGVTNADELESGSWPGDAGSVPGETICPSPEEVADFDYQICLMDYPYAFRRARLDFCGEAPSYDELVAFRALDPEKGQKGALAEAVYACLKTEFWRGPNGQVARVAHRKIRAVGPLLGFADFNLDYHYFIHSQIDGRDVREVLTGQYLVVREVEIGPGGLPMSRYVMVDDLPTAPMEKEKRAGMITMPWNLFYNTMFTGIPRGTAAAVYRAFLNLDIAQSEGIDKIVDKPLVDYDGAGVTGTGCIECHQVLDWLAYPFSTYHGLTGASYTYDPNRMAFYFPEMPGVPEAGYIFGQPVNDLVEWAAVAANSDAFYQATTEDYWKLLVGEVPSPESPLYEDYVATWQGLKADPNHSVDAMLASLVLTRAYASP